MDNNELINKLGQLITYVARKECKDRNLPEHNVSRYTEWLIDYTAKILDKYTEKEREVKGFETVIKEYLWRVKDKWPGFPIRASVEILDIE